MKDNKLRKCWIRGNICLNQTNDTRLCIQCRIWLNIYRKNN